MARTREVGATSAAPRVADLIEALDAEVRAAIADVDRTLITLSLAQSPWDRLRSASKAAQSLARIRMRRHPSAADLPALLAKLCDAGVEFIVVGGAAAVEE